MSDAGKKPENQDTIGARIPDGANLTYKGMAFVIADGVSSSESARQASQTAVTGFLNDYFATPDTWSTTHSSQVVIKSLNRYLWSQSRNSIYGQGQLTTFTSLILKGSSGFYFHIGDTRLLRIRHHELEQLTRDHNQKLDKHTVHLSRALGAEPTVDIDCEHFSLQEDDIYILSSDGVHDYLSKQDWLTLEKKYCHDKQSWAQQALQLAMEKGSRDNLSVQILQVTQMAERTEAETVAALKRLPFPPLLKQKQKVDGLKIEKILHESERSQVYLVSDTQGNRYAMKTPSPNYEDDPAYIERFILESWIGARIQSQHVVRVIQRNEYQYLYYLTEFIRGPTLANIIKERQPLPIRDTLEIIEQVIKGLRAFHRKDVLHQDLKPENIIIGHGGIAKIIDFGSSWVASVQEINRAQENQNLLGTLDYSAPEYRYGGKISTLSDQYSLATLVYEMLTGQTPYGEKYRETWDLKKFQALRYHSALEHNPLVPHWMDRALEKALQIKPNARYTSLSEFYQDLKHPNPKWSSRESALIDRNPLRFWQIVAALGWISFVCVLFLYNI